MPIDLLSIIKLVSYVFSSLTILGLVVGILSGVLPVLIRLGKGLSGRKVSIFAAGAHQDLLRNVLTDSALFRAKNIVSVQSRADLGRCEETSVFVVYWADWKGDIHDVVHRKKDQTALIIYAPHVDGPIPHELMAELERERNVVVTNFRGRLINDLIVTMIASSYEKK